jgi:CHASE2 domain-containing sensor protein
MPYAAVLDDSAAMPALAGRIVVVGVGAIGRAEANRDVFDVAEGLGSRRVYGVELHADALAALAAGRVPWLPTAGVQASIAAAASAIGAVIAVAGAGLAHWIRRALLGAVALAWLGACAACARADLVLNPAYDIAALLLAYAALRSLLSLARSRLGGGSA